MADKPYRASYEHTDQASVYSRNAKAFRIYFGTMRDALERFMLVHVRPGEIGYVEALSVDDTGRKWLRIATISPTVGEPDVSRETIKLTGMGAKLLMLEFVDFIKLCTDVLEHQLFNQIEEVLENGDTQKE